MSDHINHPDHYTHGEIECIDAIKAQLGTNGFMAYCQGNVVKYLWRNAHKGDTISDLRKAKWYLDRMLEEAKACS